MNKDLFFDGEKFISARRAAKLTGFAADYVGQLCREGKVTSKMVGRTWYVSHRSLLAHKSGESLPIVKNSRITLTPRTVSSTSGKDLHFEGVRYIPSAEAAKLVGYAADYLGELARKGLVDARMIGRTWYVSKKSILAHKKGNRAVRPYRKSNPVQKIISSPARVPHAVEQILYLAEPASVSLPLASLEKVIDASVFDSLFNKLVVSAVSLLIIGYSGFYCLGSFSPETALALDVRVANVSTASVLGAFLDRIHGVKSVPIQAVAPTLASGGPASGPSVEAILSGAPVKSLVPPTSGSITRELKAELEAYAKSQIAAQLRALAPAAPVTVVYNNTFKTEVLNQAAAHVSSQSQSDVGNVVAQFNALENGGSLTNSIITGAKITDSTFSGSSLAVDSLLGTNATTTNLFSENSVITSLLATSASSTNLFAHVANFDSLSAGTLSVDNGNFTVSSQLNLIQSTNGATQISAKRVTDSAPSGDFISYTNAAGDTPLFRVDNSGNIFAGGITNSGALTVTSLSEPQFRIQYDSLNETTVSVGPSGVTTYAANGTTPRVIWMPATNRTDSFQFQNALGVSLLNIDTQNKQVTVPNLLFTNATGTNATTTNFFATTASTTNLFATNGNIGTLTTGPISSGLINGQNISSTANFTGTMNVVGNVGIGTTNPGAKLEIASSIAGDGTGTLLYVNASGVLNTNTTLLNLANVMSVDGYGNITGRSITTGGGAWLNNHIYLGGWDGSTNGLITNAGGTGAGTLQIGQAGEKLALMSSNVGIGTTNPNFKLEVNGTASTTNLFSTNSNLGVVTSGLINGQTISSAANFTGTMNIAGNVGIGTTGPAEKLDVNGNIRLDNTGTTPNYATPVSSYSLKLYGDYWNSAQGESTAQVGGIYGIHTSGNANPSPYSRLTLQAAAVGGTMTDVLSALGNGNVGIGTTGPGYLLEVNKDLGTGIFTVLKIANANNAASVDNGTRLLFGSYTNGGRDAAAINVATGDNTANRWDHMYMGLMVRDDNNTLQDRLHIMYNGNVGIGTTNPIDKLTVQGAGTVLAGTSYRLFNVIQDQTNYRGVYLGYDTSAQIGVIAAGGASGNLAFWRNDGSTWTESMRINNLGNVGIGTTESAGKLAVVSGIAKTDTTFTRLASFRSSEALASNPLELYIGQLGNATAASQAISLQTGHYGADFAANLVLQKDGGNVGIGTTAPYSKLANTASNISDDYSGVNGGAITWYTSQADTYAMAIQNDHIYGGGLLIKAGNDKDGTRRLLNVTNGDNTSRFIVRGDGTVGIGTVNPGGYKLNIAGNGYLGAAAWVYSSDQRLKENISYFGNNTTSSLDKILQLKPARFDYIVGDKNNLGFIAQDVQQVIPEAVVVTNQTTGMLGLKTDFIVPYLVGAIQDLNGKVLSDEENLVALLEVASSTSARLDTLELRVSSLEGDFANASSSQASSTSSWQAGLTLDATTTQTVVDAYFAEASLGLKQGMSALGSMTAGVMHGTFYAVAGMFDKVFARSVHTDLICVTDANGETCVTRSQLDTVLSASGATATMNNQQSTSNNSTTTTTDTTASSTPSTTTIDSTTSTSTSPTTTTVDTSTTSTSTTTATLDTTTTDTTPTATTDTTTTSGTTVSDAGSTSPTP